MDKHTNERHEPLWIPYSTPPQTRGERFGAALRRYGSYIGMGLAVLLLAGMATFVFLPDTAATLQREFSSWSGLAIGPSASGSPPAQSAEAAPSSRSPYEGEATFSISSQPTGATVLLGRDTLGITPLRRETVEAGAQLLSVRMDGYVPTDSVMLLRSDRPAVVYVTLRRQEGGTFTNAQPVAQQSTPQRSAAQQPVMRQPSEPASRLPEERPSRERLSEQEASEQDEGVASTADASRQAAAPPGSAQENAAGQGRAAQEPPQGAAASGEVGELAGDSFSPPDEDSMFFEDESLMRLYRAHIERGNELFAEERYQGARDAFERALAVRPDDAKALFRLRKINAILEEEARDRERYAYYRAQGDLLFEQERYQEAVERYENALQFKPSDPYVTRRLEASRPRAQRDAEAARAENAARNSVPRRIGSPGQNDDGSRMNLNAATATQLQRLPGVGSALAQRIVEDREERGLFRSVRDLERVPGVGSDTVEELASLLFVQQ